MSNFSPFLTVTISAFDLGEEEILSELLPGDAEEVSSELLGEAGVAFGEPLGEDEEVS